MKLRDGSLFLLLIFVLLIIGCNNNIPKICIEDTCFKVEIAKTSEETSQGLMNRLNLDLDKGVLFLYEKPAVRYFWMMNMKIPLDIIWIDSEQSIVFIKYKALPCKDNICDYINPNKLESQYVLEINSGLSEKYNFNIGDKVMFDNIEQQR